MEREELKKHSDELLEREKYRNITFSEYRLIQTTHTFPVPDWIWDDYFHEDNWHRQDPDNPPDEDPVHIIQLLLNRGYLEEKHDVVQLHRTQIWWRDNPKDWVDSDLQDELPTSICASDGINYESVSVSEPETLDD